MRVDGLSHELASVARVEALMCGADAGVNPVSGRHEA